jgi:glucose-1-phosphate adenylyltransferase
MAVDNVLAIILAGGRGDRLSILAQERAKSAIPFVGKYRIIDFILSNCVNSKIYNVAVLTQYEPRSLIDHIGIGAPWDLDRPGCVVRVLQAYSTRHGRDWYKGTADAVYQNLQYIEETGAELILILSGDHIYRMDYSDMFKFHEETHADVTLAVTRLPEEELERFGTVIVDEAGQVIGFQEKVKKPKSNLVSMGIYLFHKDVLRQWLEQDARRRTSKHDFGQNVIPKMIGEGRIFAYSFDGYWRDVGTVQTYWQANRELLEMSPSPLFSIDWPTRTKEEERPPAIVSETANVIDSLISNGCVIEGRVEHSVLSPGVMVLEDAVVKDSIIMSDSVVGPHSVVDHSILDKEVVVEAGCHLGFGNDFRANDKEPKVVNTGITIVGKKAKIPPAVKIGRNCVICCGVGEDDFLTSEIQSGETIEPKRRRPTRKA